ncbi:hypothetical protein E1A91_A01G075600v1 [Gossypium mustelinum]|uniref:Uncharacterized protein n=1 Tax=Gossypium mustelinum TaxID=34275 RepID=A0A5D3AFJ1_GOSMU|nr:hypothetical protein E1A91_A01G075600v1 [Gossypium mustelinum]
MDSHQLFGYGVTGAGLSYSTFPSIPNRLFSSLKSDIGNSPNSPFFTPFDCDTNTTLSDSQEQHSSTENLSGLSPSCNSSLESNTYFHRLSPSLDCRSESLLFSSGGTSYTQDANSGHKVIYTLQELETALMAPDENEDLTTPSVSYGESSRPQTAGQRSRAWSQECQGSLALLPPTSFVSKHRQSTEVSHVEKRQKSIEDFSWRGIPPGNLKQLLIACAKVLSENNMDEFDKLIAKARGAVSISGEPIQRLGAYMVEGLVARKEASGSSIYRALHCREPEGKDLLSYMQVLYEICPYLKFGYMAANGAIAEACRTEDRIHIIDFQIGQGTQWMTLLQALAARPGGAPHVRITGIDDPLSKYARGGGLEAVKRRLEALSEKFSIPVEFQGMPVFAPDITRDMLDVRFIETLEYYLAMFESIDETLPRDRKERVNVEEHCLARDIVNIIACEGKERVERHELFGKWKSRLTMAGFRQYPLSSYVNSVIRGLLRCYSKHYTLVEKDGAMLLGWKDRNLISASAWHCDS